MNPLLLAGLIGQGGSSFANIIAQSRLRNQARKASKRLAKVNDRTMDRFQDLQAFIEGGETLDMDLSLYDQLVSDATNDAIRAEGRAYGDEQMRDSIRQSSSDAFGRSLNVAGSASDALGAAAGIQANENAAMRQADIDSLRLRSSAIQEARNRLFGASRERAFMNQRADMAEFASRQQQFDREIAGQRAMIGAQRDMAIGEISQSGAVAASDAAIIQGIGGIAGAGGSFAMDKYEIDQMNKMLMDMFGGDNGGGGASSTDFNEDFDQYGYYD